VRQLASLQAQFDAALAPHLTSLTGRIGLAISGGGDSMALLELAANWAHRHDRSLIGLTVDHSLRPEAADEAAFVARTCAHHGIEHRTLVWDTPQKSQARARRARHSLLAEALKQAGGQVLMTGHMADDQLENYLIRKASSSGDYGLAGMQAVAVSPVWPEGANVFLLRPLLAMRRAQLRDWLVERGTPWCEDPSNEDETYERVRARRQLATTAGLAGEIAEIQAKLSAERIETDREIAEWLSQAKAEAQQLHIPLPPLEMPIEALSTALGLLAMAVSGTDQPARAQRRIPVADALKQRKLTKTSLGGSVFAVKNQKLTLTRETNRPPLACPAAPEHRLQNFVSALRGTIPA